MSKINQAIHEIYFLEDAAGKDIWLNRMHPLAKVIVTIVYMIVVMSFSKYEMTGLSGMCMYPVCLLILSDLPVKRAFSQLKPIFCVVGLVGIANPILDRTPLLTLGAVVLTGGMVSMISLIVKAVLALLASWLLIVSTSMEAICYALQMLHVPQILVVLVMLIYRYIILMLKEAERVTNAYSMRAPSQKGIHYKAWGTLAGQMLLRSIDRAEVVYESMQLRGFHGEFYLQGRKKMGAADIGYAAGLCTLFLILRFVPVFELAGSVFVLK